MYGNPLYHWAVLAVSTALVLPLSVAILAGWTPPRPRNRRAGMRLRAHGLLCVYALILVNGVPRVADASAETVMVCTGTGFVFLAAAAVLFLLAGRRDAAEPTR
ncbi:hypothetical protein [Streptomyces sp. NPDC059786]|uniref:hypothetical protein n=1 Tax=Streptomyces sp. NPDC059786 TaxID=3346946 RepID=UPI00366280A9